MKFNVNESKLLCLLALSAPAGEPVPVRGLAVYYERPCHLERARDSLRTWNFITYDPYTDQARLIVANILGGLRVKALAQGQLFPAERPLDAVMGSMSPLFSRPPVVNSHARTVNSHSHVNMSACKERGNELHGSMSHGGDKRHDVGELAGRTTREILEDLKRLAPKISGEHLYQWQQRIERENAEAVNAVVRQCGLQRKTIKNPAGWMNAQYLKMV